MLPSTSRKEGKREEAAAEDGRHQGMFTDRKPIKTEKLRYESLHMYRDTSYDASPDTCIETLAKMLVMTHV